MFSEKTVLSTPNPDIVDFSVFITILKKKLFLLNSNILIFTLPQGINRK